MEVNKIYQGNVKEVLQDFPNSCIDMVMTSPPYWALRDYGREADTLWDNDICNCKHHIAEHSHPNPAETGCCIEGCDCMDFDECDHVFETERTPRPNLSGGKDTMWAKEKLQVKGKDNYQEFVDYNDRATYSDYCRKCNAWKGQLGLEPTTDLFIKHLCNIFDDIKRVLKDTGTIYVNLGDTYYGGGKGSHFIENQDYEGTSFQKDNKGSLNVSGKDFQNKELPTKSLCLIPHRFAIEMINRGWILRNTIIWKKNNPMPESVKDRFTNDYEYIFFFSKNKKYFFEQQFEDYKDCSVKRMNYNFSGNRAGIDRFWQGTPEGKKQPNIMGSNKRTVWSIVSQPFHEAHFATFPEKLVETPIKAGCPEFICKNCGKPKQKKYRIERFNYTTNASETTIKAKEKDHRIAQQPIRYDTKKFHDGVDTCNCNKGFESGVVLDPFFGSGTTGLVALKLNRKFIGIELNPEYVKIAEKRLKGWKEQTRLGDF